MLSHNGYTVHAGPSWGEGPYHGGKFVRYSILSSNGQIRSSICRFGAVDIIKKEGDEQAKLVESINGHIWYEQSWDGTEKLVACKQILLKSTHAGLLIRCCPPIETLFSYNKYFDLYNSNSWLSRFLSVFIVGKE